MKTISLKSPDSLHAMLNRVARQRGRSKSDVVRTAIEEHLNGEESPASGSFLEAAQKWIGCVEGPGDLSTNTRYMEGFGG
ncbi:MAG: ribbon-helix-helix protein, CopG family [Planctomycetes bacterium]|nr:ribbon-helix-helix protein, CopG family [Planctomycetota bacterium]